MGAGNKSKTTFHVAVKHDLPATMRDGTVLRADVYRPDFEGTFPVILSRTPYDKGKNPKVCHKLAERGYVVVIQDVRGRYASDGEFRPGFFSADDIFPGVVEKQDVFVGYAEV